MIDSSFTQKQTLSTYFSHLRLLSSLFPFTRRFPCSHANHNIPFLLSETNIIMYYYRYTIILTSPISTTSIHIIKLSTNNKTINHPPPHLHIWYIHLVTLLIPTVTSTSSFFIFIIMTLLHFQERKKQYNLIMVDRIIEYQNIPLFLKNCWWILYSFCSSVLSHFCTRSISLLISVIAVTIMYTVLY